MLWADHDVSFQMSVICLRSEERDQRASCQHHILFGTDEYFLLLVCSPGMWQAFWRSYPSLVQFESNACQVVGMRFVRAVAFLCAVDAHQNLRASQCVPLLDRLICQGTVATSMTSYNFLATWFLKCLTWEFMNLDAEFNETCFYSNSFSNTEQTLHPTLLWR